MDAAVDADTCETWAVDPDRVRAARLKLDSAGDAQEVADLFRLLGDPTRVRLLQALVAAEELCVCDLAVAIDVAENTVSQALRVLRTAGAVRARRDGRRLFYTVADDHVRRVLDLATEHVAHDAT